MRICASAWSLQKDFFQNKIDTVGFIELASQWGVDGVELLDFFFKNDNEVVEAIDLLDKKKLPVISLSIENDFALEAQEELESQISYVKESVDMAVRLRAPILRVLTGNWKQNLNYDICLANIVKGLKICSRYAEEKGITMVLENSGAFSGTSYKLKGIVEAIDSPNFKINVDLGNFLLQVEDPVGAVSRLTGLIGFVHMKDIKRVYAPNGKQIMTSDDYALYQGTIVGQGDVDFYKIVNILKDSGYDGFLSVEYEGVGDCIPETRESIEFVRSLLERVNAVSI